MPERRIEIFDTTSFLDEDELSPERAGEILSKAEKKECPFRFSDKAEYMTYLVLRAITALRINGRPFQSESIEQYDAYWRNKVSLAPLPNPNISSLSAPPPLSLNRANEIITAFENIDPANPENTINTLLSRADDGENEILALIKQAYLAKLQFEGKTPIITADEEARILKKWHRLCCNAAGGTGVLENCIPSPPVTLQISVGYELMAVLNDQPDTLRHVDTQVYFASITPSCMIRGRDILKHLFLQMELCKTLLMHQASLREMIEKSIGRLSPASQLKVLEGDPSGYVDDKIPCFGQVVKDGEDRWQIFYQLCRDNAVIKRYRHVETGDVFTIVLRPDGTLELPKLKNGEEIAMMDPEYDEFLLDEDWADGGSPIDGNWISSLAENSQGDTGGGSGNNLDNTPPDPDKDSVN